jgi:ankyrin repeat protein
MAMEPTNTASRLFSAVVSRDVKLCAELLRAGADPNVQNNDGQAALHMAAERSAEEAGIHGLYAGNRSLAISDLLLKSGASPHITDRDGQTPLHYAAMGASVDAVELLVNAGANVNAKNNDGNTPLHLVAPNGTLLGYWSDDELDVGNRLLFAGADPMLRNKEGMTARDVASDDFKVCVLDAHHHKPALPDLNDPATLDQIAASQSQEPKRRGMRL